MNFIIEHRRWNYKRLIKNVYILCEINISSFTPDNVIEIIKNELNKGNYIIFDCNYIAFDDNPDLNKTGIHEALLHGYDDDKQIMFTTCLINGKFVESEFSYASVEKGYKWAFEYFRNNPQGIYNRRLWFYPVTRIKLRDELHCVDPLFSHIQKLGNEYTGGKYIRTTFNSNGEEESHIYHYGMSIIDAIADFCKTAFVIL